MCLVYTISVFFKAHSLFFNKTSSQTTYIWPHRIKIDNVIHILGFPIKQCTKRKEINAFRLSYIQFVNLCPAYGIHDIIKKDLLNPRLRWRCWAAVLYSRKAHGHFISPHFLLPYGLRENPLIWRTNMCSSADEGTILWRISLSIGIYGS